ncbi:MAG TPA: biotin/lipoyl-containing protein, partial [Gammaproteobacteria bacterium]|nr:biotin/lipoyl-containing protein [Gammaproteobacteria bacterium]
MTLSVTEIKVPNIGDFNDVEIIDVLVEPGQTIEREQSLITLETDKAAMDVPSPQAGTIQELKVKKGDKVSQGSVILLLEAQKQQIKQDNPEKNAEEVQTASVGVSESESHTELESEDLVASET